jgi:4-diphosphocytidyl-2-C-methyl-D-erythritol kinase
LKSNAKVNILLKITGLKDGLHQLASRFMIVKNLYDTIEFGDSEANFFELCGEFGCKIEQNTIYKAYLAIKKHTQNKIIDDFFLTHKVIVDKKIPEFAGLAGGSSNAATFLIMLNKELSLGLKTEELAFISSSVGSDLPFFIYGYSSANVYGSGDIIEKFDEDILDIDVHTPDIQCNTKDVYCKYKALNQNFSSKSQIKNVLQNSSLSILDGLLVEDANDLYLPALSIYPKLKDYQKDGYYFSGSGSSFFRVA